MQVDQEVLKQINNSQNMKIDLQDHGTFSEVYFYILILWCKLYWLAVTQLVCTLI